MLTLIVSFYLLGIIVQSKRHLLFCGGGSGGHVMPALTVIKEFKKIHPEIKVDYIGSKNGIESELVPKNDINYLSISSGKLRRYFSLQNILDIFKIILGVIQSIKIVSKSDKNSLIVSFGGFVSVPPVLAAWICGRKIAMHEQTTRIGLANKINSYFADIVLVSFEESKKFFPPEKVFFTGYPVRKECLTDIIDQCKVSNFLSLDKKIMFVTGGGNGSKLINQLIYDNLETLRQNYFIIHQVGKQFYEAYKPYETNDYKVFDFVGPEIIDLYKLADIIVSRAGAGTVSELMALGKRSLYIPLKIAQKNEQFHNAIVAKEKLGSVVIIEDDLNNETFLNGVHDLQGDIKMCHDSTIDGLGNIIKQLEKIS